MNARGAFVVNVNDRCRTMKPPSESKRVKPPAATPAVAPQASLSPRRRWLFRLAAIVFGPLLLLAALEAGLRLAGVGHPMSFFLPLQIEGRDCLIENDRFSARFFGPEMARAPFPFAIPKVKPTETTRVFVFGESAAYGDPQPEFSLGRVLTALLEGRHPDRRFEVVNTAITAINSHVILPIARDCAGQNGDFWVIYMGNNEVVGPYGSGTVFGPQAPNLAAVRASVAFKATRIGQALEYLVRRVQKPPSNEGEWGGMMMFLRNHVRQDDPRMATVYANFHRNLQDIIGVGLRAGAEVLVGTVARNLADCAPFASEHRPGLPAAELSHWDNFYRTAVRAQEAGRAADAMDAFGEAMKLDDAFAELHFRLGHCLLAQDRDADAAREFGLACDQDALRFRADSRINNLIRQVATNWHREDVQLVDSDAMLAAQSPRGLTGGRFLYEHVHLNFEGNYLVARAFAEQIGRALPAGSERPWPTAADCARRLGWNKFTQWKAEREILSRLNHPPFNEQPNHGQQYQRLLQHLERLQPATLPDALREEALRARAAADAAPDDWILHENLARLQQQTGDVEGAVGSFKRVVRQLPHHPDAWQALGLALEQAKHDDEAISAYQQATRLHPESVAGTMSLAGLYARTSHPENAAGEFQRVLRAKPYWGPAHLGLGRALEAMGREAEARREFDEAFTNRIMSPGYLNTLAKFSFSRGWYAAAVTNFSDSLRLFPADPDTHVDLALALAKLERPAEAKSQYVEAIRLRPNFVEARFFLGLQLDQEGDTAGATAQYAETVRLKPELTEARLYLALALNRQHLDQQALDQFEEVLRREPTNQVAAAHANRLRASVPAPP